MMCPWVVFTLVIGKILFAGVPFDIICILSHLITNPVRYPLSNYEGIWNSHVESLPLRISGTWHSIMREAASLPPPRQDT